MSHEWTLERIAQVAAIVRQGDGLRSGQTSDDLEALLTGIELEDGRAACLIEREILWDAIERNTARLARPEAQWA
jgi:hypothetical protein